MGNEYWNFTIWCGFASYPGPFFRWWGGPTLCRRYNQHILSPANKTSSKSFTSSHYSKSNYGLNNPRSKTSIVEKNPRKEIFWLRWFAFVLQHINHCWLFNAKSCLYIYINYMIWFGLVLWHVNHCWLFNAKSCLYIYINYMIWFAFVLQHINHCWLFNAKSCLYIYINYMIWIWFGLVLWHVNHCWLFNAKSCLYIYIKDMICKHILEIHAIKGSNSSISNNSI